MRDFEWELVPIEVDWATALEAVECGAKEMISLASNTTFSRHYILTGEARFSVAETRGKWILR
jgi:hypothetical protein